MPPILRLSTLTTALALLTVLAPPLARPARAQAPAPAPPLTLRELLDSAVARYPAIQAAQARVRAARGTRTTAGTLGNPMLAYQVENARFPGGADVGMPAEHMTMTTLPLATAYQRGARVRQADAVVRAADADARAARQVELAADPVGVAVARADQAEAAGARHRGGEGAARHHAHRREHHRFADAEKLADHAVRPARSLSFCALMSARMRSQSASESWSSSVKYAPEPVAR